MEPEDFFIEGRGWGVVIEASPAGARWLAEFIRTRRIAPSDEARAVDLYERLMAALYA